MVELTNSYSARTRRVSGVALVVAFAALCSALRAKEEPFKTQIGAVAVDTVKSTITLQVPFITWGGDVATFHANGGLKTSRGSIFQKQGLNLDLTPGDNFDQQVKDYLTGKSPFLRGTFSMIGMASEVIGQDPRTQGVVILQLTWSAGDHMVVRNGIKTADDLRGKTILLQKGGPHVGMLDDILRVARISWDDVKIAWTKDLTGSPDSPSEIFKKDEKADACFAISPDMASLCGGLDKTGTGADGTVKGARVLVSTAHLSHSIADVYVCRKDFYDANKELVTKFVAGYLKGCEELLDLQKKYQAKDPAASEQYTRLLTMAQNIYSKQVLPTLDDADGLVSDANFVLHPGNKAFFTDSTNQTSFTAFNEQAMQLATSRGYATRRFDLLPSGLDYQSSAFRGYLSKIDSVRAEFDEAGLAGKIRSMNEGELSDGTILSFSIHFGQNEATFSEQKYASDFAHVVEAASKFGNAAVAVRGHADPSNLIYQFTAAGKKKGLIGQVGNVFTLRGKPFDMTNTAQMFKEIESGAFDNGGEVNLKTLVRGLQDLSQRRSETVRDTIVRYARAKGWQLDSKQITPIGMGAREPAVAMPANEEEAQKNRRVEFRLIKIPAEFRKKADFNF